MNRDEPVKLVCNNEPPPPGQGVPLGAAGWSAEVGPADCRPDLRADTPPMGLPVPKPPASSKMRHSILIDANPQRADPIMAKGKKRAETVFLVCEESGDHNYALKRKPGGEKLQLKKYCPRLRKHTLHTEKKK
jgi:large subunit ribosomal protein L33